MKSTGTPAATGFAMKPPKFLQTSDMVRVEIDNLGALENRIEPEGATESILG